MSAIPSYPNPTPAAPDAENVRRGLAFAALAIPAGAIAAGVVFSLLSGLPIFITAVGGLIVTIFAQWLYTVGAHAPVKRGLWPLVAICAIAVLVTGTIGYLAAAFSTFRSVGGRGGLFGQTFRDTLTARFENDPTELLLIIGLLAAGCAIGFANRPQREAKRRAAAAATAAASSGVGPGAVPPVAVAPPVASASTPVPPPTTPPVVTAPPVATPPAPVAAPPTAAPVATPPPPPPPAPSSLPGVTMTQLPGATNLPGAHTAPGAGPTAG